jgi:hypothetical protein
MEGSFWSIEIAARAMQYTGPFLELTQWQRFLTDCLCKRAGLQIGVRKFGMALMELQSLLAEQSHQRSQDPLERSEMGKYAYVRTWTDTEWDEWRTYIEGLIKGLELGYMIDYSGGMARDPDGLCHG